MNKNLIIGLVLLGLTIVYVVVAVVLVRAKQTDSKTEDDCNNEEWHKNIPTLKDGDSCSVWDSSQCRKGSYHLTSKTCISKGSVWPLILLILALACFIASIVFFVKSRNS